MATPSDEQIISWYPRLFRTALRMTGSIEDASDVTQQTFYKALARWSQFDGRASPATWLHSILINCVRDWVRRKTVRRPEDTREWALRRAPEPRRHGHQKLAWEEQLVGLREEIGNLPETLQAAFVVVVLDGYTYRQAADLLSVPVGTIGSRVCDARRRLRQIMQRRFPET